jgi:hypothetical protein
VSILYAKRSVTLFVSKTSWHFSPDTQVPLLVSLDNGQRDLFGTAKQILKFSGIHADGIDEDWLEEFASSRKMTITFKGNEPQWTVKMAGSRDATKSFRSCMKILSEDATASTTPVPDNSGDVSSEATPTSPVPTEPKKVQTVPVNPKGDAI